MPKRAKIRFIESEGPVAGLVTKFGGQPTWMGEPQWPLSSQLGEPMQFICQIRLDPEIFGSTPAQMAYLFMSDNEEHVDGTWEPEGGENAVVLQPGGVSLDIKTAPLATGPSLYRMAETPTGDKLAPVACESAVDLEFDDEAVSPGEVEGWSSPESEEDQEHLQGNKIGGAPWFLQGPEYPEGDEEQWTLLLQLDSAAVPFHVNFGDDGVGYAFLSKDGRAARFLWQCY